MNLTFCLLWIIWDCICVSLRFLSTFAGRWRNDYALLLLSAVMLFNPNNAEITCKGAVEEQQDMYRQLLKEYVLLFYCLSYAPASH